MLKHVPDRFKTQEMCSAVVMEDPLLLRYVPDWSDTQQQVKLQDDRLINWYKGCQKGKVQKAQIRKELMPSAWHPSRYWDWCISKEEKKETEKLEA